MAPFVVVAAILACGDTALGQAEGPPQPELKAPAGPIVGYGIIFVLLAAVVGVSLLPSKRGHQD